MKRVINGQSYNTETATEIMSFGPDASNASYNLYQTRHGVFFEVMIDHDDCTVLAFLPLSDDEARIKVEKYRPYLMDQYFGPFPEAGAAERRLTIRLPTTLAERVEAAAKAKNLSINSYAMRCFEQHTTFDDQPSSPS